MQTGIRVAIPEGMRVRITRKLADEIDGVDLSHNQVDEVIELPDRKARLVIAEGWAILERRSKVLPFRKRAKYARRADDPGVSRAS